MLDINKKISPEATMPLGTDADGPPFDEPWEYASIVVMLMYLSRNSKPDIQFAVNHCARLTHNPSSINSEAVKSICRYLVGTQGQGLTFDPNSDMKLNCYVDADFSGLWRHEYGQDHVCVKSRNGYIMNLVGCPLHCV